MRCRRKKKKAYRCGSVFIKKQQLRNATTTSSQVKSIKEIKKINTKLDTIRKPHADCWCALSGKRGVKNVSMLGNFFQIFFSWKGTIINKAYHKVCPMAAVYCIILWTSGLPTRLRRSILFSSSAGIKMFPSTKKSWELDPQLLHVIKISGWKR